MVLRTITIREKKRFSGARVSQSGNLQTQKLKEVFPTDVAGSINIQNKVDSPAGRGWHIGGAQKILNPDRDRLLLEEASGQTSSYVIDNIISTEYASNTNLVATDLGNDTHMLLVQNTTELVSYSFNDKQTSTIASIPKFSGRHTWNVAFPPWPGFWICGFGANNFTSSRSVEQLVELPNGEVYATDLRGTIFRVNTDGSVSNIAGGVVRTPWNWGYWGGRNGAFCRTPGVQCGGDIGQGFIPAISCPWAPHPTSGFVQQAGYAEGTLNGSRFNNPMGLIPGRLPSSLIVADSGNNRVRLVDLVNSQVSTIVGNGQTFDSGDGASSGRSFSISSTGTSL